MEWIPTEDEINYYKLLGQNKEGDIEHYRVMLPLLLGKINEDYEQNFVQTELPSNVKLFLALSTAFYGAELGLKSEKMGSTSFTYDFSTIPSTITDLLSGYDRKAKKVRFFASW